LARTRILLVLDLSLGCGSDHRLASIGDLRTGDGEVIRDCRIGYRTCGHVDASGSNAMLVLPWFLGTTRCPPPVAHRPHGLVRQAEAMADLDLSGPFGGSMARTAAQARAKALIVVSARDDLVDPGPAIELAGLSGADLLVLDGRCGHDALQRERPLLVARVEGFLESLRQD